MTTGDADDDVADASAGASDVDLLRRAAARDERAISQLVARHLRAATLLATQLLGDRDAAEDVVQESFLVLVRRAAEYDATTPLPAWLYGIVRRLARKSRARQARRWRLLERWAGTLASSTTNAEAAVELDELRSAIRDLPGMQRACCELAFVHDVAPEDIATMHAISISTVRQHIFRGRQRLRKLFAEAPKSEGTP